MNSAFNYIVLSPPLSLSPSVPAVRHLVIAVTYDPRDYQVSVFLFHLLPPILTNIFMSFEDIHVPPNLNLKDSERDDMFAACEAHNNLLRTFKDIEQSQGPTIRTAVHYQVQLQSIDKQLREARARLKNAIHFAQIHFSGTKGNELPLTESTSSQILSRSTQNERSSWWLCSKPK
jgi:hypothetical protein